MSKTKVGLAAAIAAGALTFTGVPMVSVAQQQAPSISSPSFTTVDMNAQISLTINKYKGEIGDTNTGLDDVSFDIERVSLTNPLNTAAGWQEVSGLAAATAPVDGGFAKVTLTTSGGGTARISTADNGQFTPGVYRVTEKQKEGYTVAEPFLVVLPFTDNGVWKYDQTVKPKNQEILPTKTVVDAGTTLGSELTYTIDVPVPAGELTTFAVNDTLVENLGYVDNSVTVKAIGNGVDEAITNHQLTSPGAGNSGLLKVDLLPAKNRLQELRKNDSTLKVQISFKATLKSVPENGVVDNGVTVDLPNGGTVTTETGGRKKPETRYGNLTITKTGQGDVTAEQAQMAGAEFKLYRCTQEQANGGKWTVKGEALRAATTANEPTSVTDTFVTPAGADKRSSVTVYGVQHEEYVNNKATSDQLCIVEVKAPPGFSLNPEPQPVTTDAGTNPYNMVASVENHRDSIIGNLPATGEKGVFALMAAGFALLAGGAAARIRNNRKTA